MDEDRLFQLAEKFVALGREFLEILKDYVPEYDELDDEPDDDKVEFEN